MTTELTNLPCGTVQLKVCANHLCELGWVTSHHLVPTKEAQLKQALLQRGRIEVSSRDLSTKVAPGWR